MLLPLSQTLLTEEQASQLWQHQSLHALDAVDAVLGEVEGSQVGKSDVKDFLEDWWVAILHCISQQVRR